MDATMATRITVVLEDDLERAGDAILTQTQAQFQKDAKVAR